MASEQAIQITVHVKTDVSFWDALKLRIAGGRYFERYLRKLIRSVGRASGFLGVQEASTRRTVNESPAHPRPTRPLTAPDPLLLREERYAREGLQRRVVKDPPISPRPSVKPGYQPTGGHLDPRRPPRGGSGVPRKGRQR